MADFAKALQLGVLFSTERRNAGGQCEGETFFKVVI
jgi:hypothetical protein